MRASEAVERALGVVADREPQVRAWAYLDVGRARAEAAEVDRRTPGPLRGLVLGVKDIFDTADQPTEYGSPIYAGHRPRGDAAAVALLRGAGATCLGKTVTAELACTHPGATTNPYRADHTPGGSSSGSAAAVATGMADIALGTQTLGSVIRPASFCGIYGFKPTFGTVSTAGMKPVAPSLDTVGWFARDPELLDTVRASLTGRPAAQIIAAPPAIGVYRSDDWNECSDDSRNAVTLVADLVAGAGAPVAWLAAHDSIEGLGDQAPIVMAYEAARSLTWERRKHRAQLSPELAAALDWGASLDPRRYDAAQQRRARAVADLDGLFGSADVLLTPAALGEAPAGLESTGDPRPARLWTLLGLPSVTIPAATGCAGLPVGVQLVGRLGADALLLSVAVWVAAALRRT